MNLGSFDVGQYFECWSERVATPSFMHDADLRLLWMNVAGERLLTGGKVLTRQGNAMAWVGLEENRGYSRFIAGVEVAGTWAYRPRSTHARVVRVNRLEPENLPVAFAIVIFDVERADDGNSWADLGATFGLTPAEAEVTRRVVEGFGVVRVAIALGISPETVRTHLKRVYSKLGVKSRDEMFAMVAPYRAQ
ncbi:hypothetical protein MMB232_01708 [Brevundimonas subvibrioides]|uniref:helix-turn-helix transcriptional regulator n=1 Tax=Brevundimonas subvibrioides TaxID=74313 RepID=UPI0032D59883